MISVDRLAEGDQSKFNDLILALAKILSRSTSISGVYNLLLSRFSTQAYTVEQRAGYQYKQPRKRSGIGADERDAD